MAELITKSIDVAPLSAGNKIKIRSTKGRSLYFSVSGVGFIGEDSTWQLLQSTDGVNWTLIAGSQFTGENAVSNFNLGEVLNGIFIGAELINKMTETAGVVTIEMSIKD